jgi:pimeloyl-ACP methyl ester carboxylesterase
MIGNDAENFVSVNGLEMFYEDYGEGPVLLLLHAGIVTSKMWESYFSIFSQSYRVIAPDSRGHGRTNNPSSEWNYSIMTDDIAAFMMELDLHKPHICGWSDGAQIGLDLAIRYPDIASSYIIGGALKDNLGTNFELLMERGYYGPGDVNFAQIEENVPDYVERIRDYHSSRGAEYWKEYLIGISKLWWFTPFKYDDDELINIQAPVLFVIGDRDEDIPVETAVAMHRLTPNSELAVIPNADHYIPRTHVKEFSSLILEFIKRHSAHENLS